MANNARISASKVLSFRFLATIFLALVLMRHSGRQLGLKNVPETLLQSGDKSTLHVLVTGGAGFIGSHATLRLLEEGFIVTIFDNFSRGNAGAVRQLKTFSKPDTLRVVEGDLGHQPDIERAFVAKHVDVVLHFAAVAYVGESMSEPLLYFENITANTLFLLKTMQDFGVKSLVYSSTCATYGNPPELPITELTPTNPINPYGKAKLYAENIIQDYARKDPEFEAAILRYFNVYGSDPEGRLGEFPRPELRNLGRISGACFDAALGIIDELVLMGTDFPTADGTCVRDYIHVTDLVEAHVSVIHHVKNPPALYNVGTGSGVSVKQFVDACKRVTNESFTIRVEEESRPGDYAEVYADVSKIRAEIGWVAKHTDIDESLRHAWEWRRAHPDGY